MTLLHFTCICVNHYNESGLSIRSTGAILLHVLGVLQPHPLFTGALTAWQRFKSDLPNPCTFQIAANEGLLAPVFSENHDQRGFTHSPIREQQSRMEEECFRGLLGTP